MSPLLQVPPSFFVTHNFVTRMTYIVDAVLLQQGHEALVASNRTIKSGRSGIKTIGKSLTKPLNRFSKDGLVRYIISLPLNSLPVVGTVVFLFYNGASWYQHAVWYQNAVNGRLDTCTDWILERSQERKLDLDTTRGISSSKGSIRSKGNRTWRR